MNELKDRLATLGLNPETVDQVITTVAEFAKSKAPENFHPMIDNLLAGNTPDLGALGSITSMLGSFFGKK